VAREVALVVIHAPVSGYFVKRNSALWDSPSPRSTVSILQELA
jgi:hypothetical protein